MPRLGSAMAFGIKALAFFVLVCIIHQLGPLPAPGRGYQDAGHDLKSRKGLQTEMTTLPAPKPTQKQGFSKFGGFWRRGYRDAGRLMIGSTAPTCTYNECRGCRFKCTAEQVPVDANDPINSAYHYRCVCHQY